ncbi:MAG: CidA/LrgA family protein [Agathobacter sp.]|nr:CidA/LrgA family protein [Agathobacter sp.]
MKYLKQFLIITAITFIGEIIKYVLPFPVPASIYGMVIMFLALVSGILKLDDVKETSDFLIKIMPVMFISAGVGLIDSFSVLYPILLKVSIITVVTIITVMVVTGHVTQFVIGKDKKK